MSASGSHFHTTVTNYIDNIKTVFQKMTAFKPVNHFLKGATHIFGTVSFLQKAPQTLAVVKDILKLNLLEMAAPLVAYSLVRVHIEQQSTEYQLIGLMSADLIVSVFIKLPVWIMHTTLDNPAYSLMLPRTIALDTAYFLPHQIAKGLGEKLSPIFVEIFVTAEKNQNVFFDKILINLYPVLSGFLKSPTKTTLLEKSLIEALETAIDSTFNEKNLIPSNFTETERKEVIEFVAKRMVIILSALFKQESLAKIQDELQEEIPGIKKHFISGRAFLLMKEMNDSILKVLLNTQSLLPRDSIESCRCNIRKKALGNLFKPLYISGYAFSFLLPDIISLFVVVRPETLFVAHTIASYMSLLLKVSSATKISSCTRHFSQTYSANQFYFLCIAIICQLIEILLQMNYFNYTQKDMRTIDRFLVNDALLNVSLTFAMIASLAFTEKLPATNKKVIDFFAFSRFLTRKTVKVMAMLIKTLNEMFFEIKINSSPFASLDKIKKTLSSPYLQVTAEWLLQRKTYLPMKLFYLIKNPQLKNEEEYKVELLPIILERPTVAKLVGLYGDDIKHAISMVKIMQMLADLSIRSPASAFITTCLLSPLYALQNEALNDFLVQLEGAVNEYNKKFQVPIIEEKEIGEQVLAKEAVIVSNHEIEPTEEEDFLLVEESDAKLDKPPSSLFEMPQLISYAAQTIWLRLSKQNKAQKNWNTLVEEQNGSSVELKNF